MDGIGTLVLQTYAALRLIVWGSIFAVGTLWMLAFSSILWGRNVS